MLILVNFVPLLVAMKCRDLVQSNRWIKLVLLPSNKRIHDTSICFLPRYEKVAWCHRGWIVGCTKISNSFQISILPWYMLYIYERRPKRGIFGIFRCPKMGLWVPEFKIWDHFFTPTSHQNGGQARKTPQKSFFFAFLIFFHKGKKYIKLEKYSQNFLIFWCTLVLSP